MGSDNQRIGRGREKEKVLFPVPGLQANMPEYYAELLDELKNKIETTRLRALLSANAELVLMYWDIGQVILEKQEKEGWGARVIDRLSHDLQEAFPDMKGFSP